MTNGKTGNAVAMVQQPMSDRESGLGWCMGAKVEKFCQRHHGDTELWVWFYFVLGEM